MDTFKGNPCQHGHDGTRNSQTRACVECTRDRGARRNAARRGDPEYLERHRVHQRTYAERHHERLKGRKGGRQTAEQRKAWKLANPDKVQAERARYRARIKAANAPAVAARKAAQTAARDARRREAEQQKEARRIQREERARGADERRRAKDRAKAKHRRAVKRGAPDGKVTAAQLAWLLMLQRGRCAYCGNYILDATGVEMDTQARQAGAENLVDRAVTLIDDWMNENWRDIRDNITPGIRGLARAILSLSHIDECHHR